MGSYGDPWRWPFAWILLAVGIICTSTAAEPGKAASPLTKTVSEPNPVHNERVCSTWGNFNFKTFDGDVFSLPSTCNYILTSQCRSAYEDFNIQLRREVLNGEPTIGRIVMKLDGTEVELDGGVVTVDGQRATLPFSHSGILIESSTVYIKVTAKLGLVAMWNRKDAFMVGLDGKYQNQTCGLCGDFNGIQLYDEFIQNGHEISAADYGQFAKMNDPTESCSELPTPSDQTCTKQTTVCEEKLTAPEFSSCLNLVSLDDFIKTCEADLCHCAANSTEFCLCSTVSEFSRQCTHAGGKPGQWRTPSFCPKTCPTSMVYQECGNPCINTCSNPDRTHVCEEHCIDGCFCPPGTMWDDLTGRGCIVQDECSCIHDGKVYQAGQNFSTNCKECTCTSSRWSCVQKDCPSTCSVEGGSHITTFDAKSYDFHGDCTYILTEQTGGADFVVVGELVRCGLTTTETCLKAVTLSLHAGTTVFNILPDGKVFINRIFSQLPLSTAGVNIFRPTTFYIIVQTSFGLQMEIQLVPIMQVYITVDVTHKQKLLGLCGNFNDVQNDDFTTMSGSHEGTGVGFANSWRTRANCPEVKNTFENPCSLSSENEKYAQRWCSLLMDPHGVFAPCHSVISPDIYEKNCMYDTCNCENSESCMCAALSAYVHACASRGINLGGWRNQTCSIYSSSCPSTMVYSYDVRTSAQSCRCHSDPDFTCAVTFEPVDGCVCAEGAYLDDDGKCVTADQCSCHYKGSVILPAEVVSKDGTVCTCKNGKLSCIGTPSDEPSCTSPMTFFNCSSATAGSSGSECQKSCNTLDMSCISTECISGCVCPSGLVSDGKGGCIKEDLCPCVHNSKMYQPGEKIKVDCNDCVCKDRKWQCSADLCHGTCTVYGDGHYITFDGRRYTFDGDCAYTLVRDNCGHSGTNGTFQVITENIPCGTTGTTCSKGIKLFLGNNELVLSDGGYEVIQRDSGEEIPYQIRIMGLYMVVEAKNGLILMWDQRTSIFIKLSPDFKGDVCGLCGNYDGNTNNDFTLRNQAVVNNPLDFGNSWKDSSSCPNAGQIKNPCVLNPYRQAWAQKHCSIIMSETFTTCHVYVDPMPYYTACVRDACACDSGGDCECFCTAVAAYTQACNEDGVFVSWRMPKICPVFCDYYNPPDECEWHYKPHGSSCMKTCTNPDGKCSPQIPPLEGCYPNCPPDRPYFDEDTMKCVKKENCGCYYRWKHYSNGQEVPSTENCQICRCDASEIKCQHDETACSCTYNNQTYKPNEIIYHSSNEHGMCITLTCGANGNIERNHYVCSTTAPMTTTTPPSSTTETTTSTTSTTETTRPPPTTPPPSSTTVTTTPTPTSTTVTTTPTPTSTTVTTTPTPTPAPTHSSTTVPTTVFNYTTTTTPVKTPHTATFTTWTTTQPPHQCEVCTWTPWMNVDYPKYGPNGGDNETIKNIIKSGKYKVCEKPVEVKCQAVLYPDVPLRELHQNVTCNDQGLLCENKYQELVCLDYEVKANCCELVDCSTTTPKPETPKPSTKTLPPSPTTETTKSPTTPVIPSTTTVTTTLPPTSTTVTTTPPPTTTPSTTTETTTSPTPPPSTTTVTPTPPPTTTPSTTTVTTTPPPTTTPSTTTETTTSPTPPPSTTTVTPTPPQTTTPSTTTVTTTPPPTTTPSTTTVTPTPPPTTSSHCNWSDWLDFGPPTQGPNGGEFVPISRIHASICSEPLEVQCRAKTYPEFPLSQLGQEVTCNIQHGLMCFNKDQGLPQLCLDYEIRVFCCEIPISPSTTPTPPSSTTVTPTPPPTTTPSTTTVTPTPLPTTTPSTTTVTPTPPPTTTPSTTTVTPTPPPTTPSSTTVTATPPPTTTPSTTTVTPTPLPTTTPSTTTVTPTPPPTTPSTTTETTTSPTAPTPSSTTVTPTPLPTSTTVTPTPPPTTPSTTTVTTTPPPTTTPSTTTETTTSPTPPPSTTTVTPTPPSTTPPSTTTVTPTPAPTTSSHCNWSDWLDFGPPTQGPNGGEFVPISRIHASICSEPLEVQCRAKIHPEFPLSQLGQEVTCNTQHGLMCFNKDQGLQQLCLDYEIRVFCCEIPISPSTTPTPPSTTTVTPTPAPTTPTPSTTTVTPTPPPTTPTPSTTTVTPTPPPTPPPSTTTVTPTPAQTTPTPSSTTVTPTPPPTTTPSSTTVTPTPPPTTPLTTTVTTTPPPTTTPSTTTETTTSPTPPPSTTTVTPTPPPTTTPSTTTVTPTPPLTTSSHCNWSDWLDFGPPTQGPNGGEFVPISRIHASICSEPLEVQCRAKTYPEFPLSQLGQEVTCNTQHGLMCFNKDQGLPQLCLDYEIRVFCCNMPISTSTTPTPPSTTTVTPTPPPTTTPSTTTVAPTPPPTTTPSTTTVTPTPPPTTPSSTTVTPTPPPTTTPSTTTVTPTPPPTTTPSTKTVTPTPPPTTTPSTTTVTPTPPPTTTPSTTTVTTTPPPTTTPSTTTVTPTPPPTTTPSTTTVITTRPPTTTPSTTTETTTSPTPPPSITTVTPTPPPTTSSYCNWSDWLDFGPPTQGPNGGEFVPISRIHASICSEPLEVQCRAKTYPEFPLSQLGQEVTCNTQQGLMCFNKDQGLQQLCLDYEIRVFCCEIPISPSTTPTPPSTTTVTPTSAPTTPTPSTTTVTPTPPPTTPTPSTTTVTPTPPPTPPPSTTTVTPTPAPTTPTPSSTTVTPTPPPTTTPSSTTVTPTPPPTTPSTTTVTPTPPPTTTPSTTTVTPTPPPTSTTVTPTPPPTTPLTTTVTTTPPPTTTPSTTTETTTSPTPPPSTTTVTPTPPPTTTPSTTTVTTTPPLTTSSHCNWSDWLDFGPPTQGPNGGEFVPISRIHASICSEPLEVQCRAKTYPEFPLSQLGQEVTCNTQHGLMCFNKDQGLQQLCLDYEIRVFCCEITISPSTTPTPTSTETSPTTPVATTETETTTSTTPAPTHSSSTEPTTPRSTPLSTTEPTTSPPPSSTKTTIITSPATTQRPETPSHPTTQSSTHFVVVTSSTTTPSTDNQNCKCESNGVSYEPGSVIYNTSDHEGYCYVSTCYKTEDGCELKAEKPILCSTTAPTAPPTTKSPNCDQHNPPIKNGKTILANCSMITCNDGEIVSVPVECKKPPVCVNKYPPVQSKDQSGCCVTEECQCVCTGFGDPHYITFDGTYYPFQGNCSYVLVKEIHPKYHFSVIIDNVFCDAQDGLSCPKSLHVFYQSYEIDMGQEISDGIITNLVDVNKQRVSLPYGNRDFQITDNGIATLMVIPEINARVTFTGMMFFIDLPWSKFNGNTEGQCGTCSNNRNDDCRLPNGTVILSCEKMANHWKVGDNNTYCPEPKPVPTPKPCTNSPICDILIKDFKECHPFVPYESFYEGCNFDVCHIGNESIGCSSLQKYAEQCALAGICVDWRNSTDGVCEYKCKQPKQYRACAQQVAPTCDTHYNLKFIEQASAFSAMEGVFWEGCYCPEGTTQYMPDVDLCIPSCDVCFINNTFIPVNSEWTEGCQKCMCEEKTKRITCAPVTCSQEPVTCKELGQQMITQTVGCCQNFTCVCNISLCPNDKPDCPAGFRLHAEIDGCCTVYSCEPRHVCVFNNTEYQPGVSVPERSCEHCVCVDVVNSATKLLTTKCSPVPCDTNCPMGYEYQAVDGQCCGKCVQTKCVYTHDNITVTIAPGQVWTPPDNNCTTVHCVKNGNNFNPKIVQQTCPPFYESDCVPGTIVNKDCCPTCVLKNKPCNVTKISKHLESNGCRTKYPVETSTCEGSCVTSSLYSLAANAFQHECSCCSETGTSEKKVELICPDGTTVTHTYFYIERCDCNKTDCSAQGTSPAKKQRRRR